MATILGTTGADQLGASGMTITADRISAGAGNDTLVYDLATAGGADTYYGGTNVDTLELNLTAAEWATHRVKVLALQKAVNDAPKPSAGAVAGGTNFGKLDFGNGKTLQVYEVEAVKIFIDGNLYTGDVPVNKAVSITSAAQAGSVTEDGTLAAAGAVEFVDADLADAHQASFVAAAGQTALGTFELDTVNEDAESADGMVSWTYNLNNNSAAVQALGAGDVVTERYTVSVTDGKGSTVQQVVTITIKGMADAPPIVVTDTGAVVENGAAGAGTASTGGKMPLDGVTPAAVWGIYNDTENFQYPEGTFNGYDWGTFTITDNGTWKFVLNQAKADFLTDGDEVTLSFAVTATEDGSNSVRREVTVTLTGADDATVVTVAPGADTSVTEAGGVANATDNNAGASGQFVITDPDSSVAFLVDTYTGTYGDLSIDAAGNWGYALRNDDANVQALREGQAATDTIVVKLDNGTTQTVRINVTGADDAATMSMDDTLSTLVDAAGFLVDANGTQIKDTSDKPKQVTIAEAKYDNLVHEAPGKNYAGAVDYTTSGKLTLSDPDGGELKFHALDSDVREDELFAGSVAKGTYGSFTLNAATGEWSYALDNTAAATQELKAADRLTDTVVIYSADGHSSQRITVHVQGAEDGFSKIEADTSDPTYNTVVFEDVAVDADGDKVQDTDENGNLVWSHDLEAKGKLNAIDPDGADPDAVDGAPTEPFTAGIRNGKFGKLDLKADGTWTYTANSDDEDTNTAVDSNGDGNKENDLDIKSIERLAAGQVATESFVVKTTDGQASYAITVRLTGANDGAQLFDVTPDANKDGASDGVYDVVEAGGVNNAVPGNKLASGVLQFIDSDDGESSFAASNAASKVGTYGNFTLNKTTGAWNYTLDNLKTAVQQLKANELVTDSWVLTSKDGSTDTLTVRVHGSDDATTITKVSGEYKTTESGGLNNAVKGDSSAGGVLKIEDPDGTLENSEATFASLFSTASKTGLDTTAVGKAPVWAAVNLTAVADALDDATPVSAVGGKVWSDHGYFTFNGDTKAWTYTLVEAAIKDADGEIILESVKAAANNNALQAGQKSMDALRVYSSNMAYSVDLNVDIVGANDGTILVNTLTTDTETEITEDLSLQVRGYEPVKTGNVVTGANPIAAALVDEFTSGKITGGDPDLDVNKNGTPDMKEENGPAMTFKAVTAAAKAGKFGNFTFGEGTGEWTYTLNSYDKDTRALAYGAKATDQLAVTAADGTVHTITVNIVGANDAPTLNVKADGVTAIQPTINKDGSIKFNVLDGDTGGKLTMQLVEQVTSTVDGEPVVTSVTRDVTALVVNDGAESIVKAATANSTVLYTGLMQVTDKTVGHPALQLGTYLGMGTKGNDTIDSTVEDPSIGSLVSAMDGNDTVNTGAGTDYISGGLGNDSITSGKGADTILGGAGNDIINAGDGDDRIESGAGNDAVTGGDGNDTFVFATLATDIGATNFDTISDFASHAVPDEVAYDFIQVSKALLGSAYVMTDVNKDGFFEAHLTKATNPVSTDWLKEGDFKMTAAGKVGVGGTALDANKSDRMLFDTATGTLWYDADGVSGGAVKVAVLTGVDHIDAADFQFV